MSPDSHTLEDSTVADAIQLLVFGVDEPGESITVQLVQILRSHINRWARERRERASEASSKEQARRRRDPKRATWAQRKGCREGDRVPQASDVGSKKGLPGR